jgi:membrane fusion protein, multidrug efflux system
LQAVRNGNRRRLIIILAATAVILLAVIGRGAWNRVHAVPAKVVVAPVAATLGTADEVNLPVYALGIGNVQANYSVTVHVRVNGQLETVAYKEGQDVRQGDLLAQIDPLPFRAAYQAAVAQTARDDATYQNALVDLKRYTTLLESDSIAEQTLATQKATVAQLKATVDFDRAQADAAKVNLDYTTIRSPISGRTGLRLVDPGNIVQTTDVTGLVVINQIDPISVVFTLPEEKFALVNRAIQAARPKALKVEAHARTGDTLLGTGELLLINNQIDTNTGTVQLKATFANADHKLWPGEYVNAHIITSVQPVVLVDSAAVQRGANGLFIWTVDAGDIAQMQPVTVELEQDGKSVVHGIPAGTRVVIDGQYRMKPGAKVAAVERPAAGAAPAPKPSSAG